MAGSIPRDHPLFFLVLFLPLHLYQHLDGNFHWRAARQRAYGIAHHRLVHYIFLISQNADARRRM